MTMSSASRTAEEMYALLLTYLFIYLFIYLLAFGIWPYCFAFSALTLLVGRQEEHTRPVKIE